MLRQIEWETLTAAVEKIAAIDLGQLEEAQSFDAVAPTCNEIHRAMRAIASAVDRIQASYEEDLSLHGGEVNDWEENSDMEPQSTRPALRKIDQISAGETGKQRIADLAWLAARTLRQKIALLEEAIQSQDIWRAIGQCLGSKRLAVKTGTAIEQALSTELSMPLRLAGLYDTEIERSLRIRKLYVRFRSQMMPDLKPDLEDIELRLRMVAVAFAKVFGERAYDDVRVQDKQLFRKLQGQVVGWMRSRRAGDGEATLRVGFRIWQEAAAFAECLMVVNNRTELRDHDRALAKELAHKFIAGELQSGRSGIEFWERVKYLEGRDEELDRLIADRVLLNDERWLKVLERVGGISKSGVESSPGLDLPGQPEEVDSKAVHSVEW